MYYIYCSLRSVHWYESILYFKKKYESAHYIQHDLTIYTIYNLFLKKMKIKT